MPVQALATQHISNFIHVKCWAVVACAVGGCQFTAIGGGSERRFAQQRAVIAMRIQLHCYRVPLGPPNFSRKVWSHAPDYRLYEAIDVFGVQRILATGEPWGAFADGGPVTSIYSCSLDWYAAQVLNRANAFLLSINQEPLTQQAAPPPLPSAREPSVQPPRQPLRQQGPPLLMRSPPDTPRRPPPPPPTGPTAQSTFCFSPPVQDPWADLMHQEALANPWREVLEKERAPSDAQVTSQSADTETPTTDTPPATFIPEANANITHKVDDVETRNSTQNQP
jgi:hypothetical protein